MGNKSLYCSGQRVLSEAGKDNWDKIKWGDRKQIKQIKKKKNYS
jgi:hypothetical protein